MDSTHQTHRSTGSAGHSGISDIVKGVGSWAPGTTVREVEGHFSGEKHNTAPISSTGGVPGLDYKGQAENALHGSHHNTTSTGATSSNVGHSGATSGLGHAGTAGTTGTGLTGATHGTGLATGSTHGTGLAGSNVGGVNTTGTHGTHGSTSTEHDSKQSGGIAQKIKNAVSGDSHDRPIENAGTAHHTNQGTVNPEVGSVAAGTGAGAGLGGAGAGLGSASGVHASSTLEHQHAGPLHTSPNQHDDHHIQKPDAAQQGLQATHNTSGVNTATHGTHGTGVAGTTAATTGTAATHGAHGTHGTTADQDAHGDAKKSGFLSKVKKALA